MLKGHTRIELTDVHTGKKEVVEKHNLITNNLSNILNYLPLGKSLDTIKDEQFPAYENIMGGIILFSNPLEESTDNILLPPESENPITGYASNTVNSGTDEKRGSKNLTESIKLDNGYKYVWDFGTAQANGTISAVSLCDAKVCENHPFYDSQQDVAAIVVNDDIGNGFVEYDFDNDIATCILTTDPSTVAIKKYTLGTKKVRLDGPFTVKLLSTQNIVSPISLPMNGSWRFGDDGYYYYYKYESGSSQYLARMKKDTLAIDTKFGLKNFNATMSDSYGKLFCIANGYIYLNYGTFKKVNLSDMSRITILDTEYAVNGCLFSYNGIVYTSDKIFFANDTSVDCKINYNVRTFVSNSGKYVNVHPSSNSFYAVFGYLKNNLCTINNLDAPVTKTADKTMKIIYTITET